MPRLHFPLILLTFTLLLLETPVFVSASPIPYTYTSSSLTGSEVEASGSQRAWTPEQIKEVEMMRIAGAAEVRLCLCPVLVVRFFQVHFSRFGIREK